MHAIKQSYRRDLGVRLQLAVLISRRGCNALWRCVFDVQKRAFRDIIGEMKKTSSWHECAAFLQTTARLYRKLISGIEFFHKQIPGSDYTHRNADAMLAVRRDLNIEARFKKPGSKRA